MKKIIIFILIATICKLIDAQSWRQASRISVNENIYDLISFNGKVYAATMSGIYRSLDNGQSWVEFNNGIPDSNNFARAFSKYENKLYVGNSYGVFSISDTGTIWQDLNLPDHAIAMSVFADDYIILAGIPGGGLFRSADYGATWNGVAGDHIYKIAKAKQFYFAGSWGDVIYSDDKGLTWQPANLNEFVWWIFSLNDTIFAFATDGGLFKTAPNNISWQAVGGITETINGIAVKNDNIIAVTPINVKYSKYSEQNLPWKTITNNGLPNLGDNELWSSAINNNYVTIGTSNDNSSGLGIWYININEIFTSVNDNKIPNSITLYPNPATDFINIKNAKPNSKVTIYDLTGKQLINCKLEDEQINISELPNSFCTVKIISYNLEIFAKFIKQ